MKQLSVLIAGAALLASSGVAWAQTPTPPDSVAAPRDTVAAPAAPAAPAATTAAPTSTTAAPTSTTPAPTSTPPAPTSASTTSAPAESRLYYGGAIGFSFWGDYFRISFEPLAAYKVTPKLSIGGKVRYEYLNDSRGLADYDSHNYGASVFSRFRLVPQLYAHGEYATMSYEYPSGRETVPFLLVGGGLSQRIRGNVWSNVEVVWDLLNDSNSPYEEGRPLVSVGVGVGF